MSAMTAAPVRDLEACALLGLTMSLVELVRLNSNLEARTEIMLQLRVKATSKLRPRERPTSTRKLRLRLDPNQSNALAMAYREGKTIKELAGEYGVHRVTVASLLRRRGVERRKVGLTDEQVAEASRLCPEGWSLARLAERYDVDGLKVCRYLLLAGVIMRSPHQRRDC